MRVSMQQFEAAAQAAVDSIPDEFKPYLENTVFVIEERSPEDLMGLYEGATALGAGEGLPERITLYKRGHERAVEFDRRAASTRSAGRSSTRSATTSAWTRRTCLLAKGPERAVPQDQGVARALDGKVDLADADVVVAGSVDLRAGCIPAMRCSPRSAGSRWCRGDAASRAIARVHGRGAAGEPLGDELL